MTTLSAVVDRVRLELADLPTSFDITLVGNGSQTRFETETYPLDGLSLTVTVNGTPTTSFTIEERTGIITFTTAPAADADVRIRGTKFRYFGATDITTIVTNALNEHIYNRTDTWGRAIDVTNLPIVEEYALSLLGTIKCLFTLATDSAFDIDISAPDGVQIPRSERYRQLLEMVSFRQQQYREICAALNVGLERIEVTTLRRVSRTTGRLIPIYVEQEVENISPAVRILPPIDRQGQVVMPDSVPDAEVVITATEPFTMDIDTDQDLTGFTIKATLRAYRNSGPRTWFAVTVNDLVAGTITCSLTPAQTRVLGGGPYWWDLIILDANKNPFTVVEGPVLVEDRSRLV